MALPGRLYNLAGYIENAGKEAERLVDCKDTPDETRKILRRVNHHVLRAITALDELDPALS